MPTTRPRHTITETPPVQEELNRLRAQIGSQKIDFAELVMLGAREKRRQLEQSSEAARAARERLAKYILEGEDDPELVRLADEVKTLGLIANYPDGEDAAA
jgi:DNA-binding PadR family transcriptional regulator